MGGDQDPLSELRETLRKRPAAWQPERPRRRLPALAQLDRLPHPAAIAPRSILARFRPPDLRPRIGRSRRRAGDAISRASRATWSYVGMAVRAIGVAGGRVGRAAERAARWVVHRLVMAAAGLRIRRSRRLPIEPDPVQPDPIPPLADDGTRHLEELERRQLEQRIEALGPDHPDVAILLQLVAERSARRGAPDEALALYARALRIQELTFGPDSPALRPLLADLADLELELGHEADALLHRSRRDMLEPRSTAPADRVDLDGALASRTSHPPNGIARTRQ
ncbi:MAG TPA: tetratricopeptide repeat protein [Candidatus Saccharimonadales bacterium]|jgi:hypothetical protein|nr:tetratricopeptide repeat protein [Candidatus Saccharimonadales bacterium]